MPQQLDDLTLADVEDMVPALEPLLTHIVGHIGVIRYTTKLVLLPVQAPTVSFCTYLQCIPPMSYERAARDLQSSNVPEAYTTIKTKR